MCYVDAKSFYEKFKEKVKEGNSYKNIKYSDLYKDNRQYTNLINEHIIPEIISEDFNLKSQREYLRIDVIGWSQKKDSSIESEAKNLEINPYLWDLEIAVEHENNEIDWSDEVLKLMHVSCGLKVIIGYSPYNKREDDIKKLNFVAKCMKETKAFAKSKYTKEEYLVILGNSGQENANFNYIGYIYNYDEEKFIKI